VNGTTANVASPASIAHRRPSQTKTNNKKPAAVSRDGLFKSIIVMR
jgi:hypothetical protein